jgi:hypothetical protein
MCSFMPYHLQDKVITYRYLIYNMNAWQVKYLGITVTSKIYIQDEILTLNSGNASSHLLQNLLYSLLISKHVDQNQIYSELKFYVLLYMGVYLDLSP